MESVHTFKHPLWFMSCSNFPLSPFVHPTATLEIKKVGSIVQISVERLREIASDQVPKRWLGKVSNPGHSVYPGLTNAVMLTLSTYQAEDVDFPLQLWNPHLAQGKIRPSAMLAFAHGGQLWLPPGVDMEQSQDCTSKTSREVCTASSWLWPQLHAFWAVWN